MSNNADHLAAHQAGRKPELRIRLSVAIPDGLNRKAAIVQMVELANVLRIGVTATRGDLTFDVDPGDSPYEVWRLAKLARREARPTASSPASL